jgi:hypothetical protein
VHLAFWFLADSKLLQAFDSITAFKLDYKLFILFYSGTDQE